MPSSYTPPVNLASPGPIGGTTPAAGSFTTLSWTGGTFTLSNVSVTALATPSAISATQSTSFASTVSGAVIMGFGTTGDVTLKNRAGTSVFYIGPNTDSSYCVGKLFVGGTTDIAGTGGLNVAGGSLWVNGRIECETTWGSRNNSKMYSPVNGRLEVINNNASTTDTGIILGSANGTRYAITVSDLGVVTSTAV